MDPSGGLLVCTAQALLDAPSGGGGIRGALGPALKHLVVLMPDAGERFCRDRFFPWATWDISGARRVRIQVRAQSDMRDAAGDVGTGARVAAGEASLADQPGFQMLLTLLGLAYGQQVRLSTAGWDTSPWQLGPWMAHP